MGETPQQGGLHRFSPLRSPIGYYSIYTSPVYAGEVRESAVVFPRQSVLRTARTVT